MHIKAAIFLFVLSLLSIETRSQDNPVFPLNDRDPQKEIFGDSGNCSPPSADGKCGVCDQEEIAAFQALADNPVSSDGQVLDTVDKFISQLPESLRSSFIFMSESRSFQRSNFENPRVVMKSQNSDIVMSFNGHKDIGGDYFVGQDRLEVMIWNGDEAKFDFIDIQFPAEGSGAAGDKPIIVKNDSKCLNCHGNDDPRPNWDPYNFWAGQMPFNRDTLAPGTMEADYYLELIKQTEGNGSVNNPRMQALTAQWSASQLESMLSSGGPVRVNDFGNGDGPGVRMFDQLTPRNFCRIGNRLKERDDIEALRPYFTGIKAGCSDLESFIPEGMRKLNNDFFQRRGVGLDSNNEFSLDQLSDDTRDLQQAVKNDKEERHFWAIQNDLRRVMGDDVSDEEIQRLARAEMDKIVRDGHGALENRETSSNGRTIANYRYILEPLGVDVSNWSMSIDPGSFSFADLLGQLESYVPSFDVPYEIYDTANGPELFCNQLKEESLKRLAASETYRVNLLSSCNDDFQFIPLNPTELYPLMEAPMDELRTRVFDEIFENYECAFCHMIGIDGAPDLPFDNPERFEKMIMDTANSSNGGWGQQIYTRINRSEGAKGHMPLGGGMVTPERRELLRSYINAIKAQAE